MKITLNRLFCYVMGSLWAGFILWNLLEPEKTFSQNENRTLAKKPIMEYGTFMDGSYMKAMDEYVNDQFLFRDQWIGIQTGLEIGLQKKDINQVYLGKDGYLIEKHEKHLIDHEQEAKNKERLIEFIQNMRDRLGNDKVYAMLVPTASEILTEKLPPFASAYDQNELLDQMAEGLDGSLIDIRDALKEHRDEYIYYRTDHHWTTLGAFYGYQAWAETMGFEGYEQEDFGVEEVSSDFYGTVYSKVQMKVDADQMYLYHLKDHKEYQVVYDMMKSSDRLYELSHLEGKDKYSVYLDGNHGLVEIKTNVNNGRKLLVIKDSYAHSFVPFAANHYEEIYMIDFRYFNGGVEYMLQTYGITDILVLYHTMGFVKDLHTGQFMN